MTAPLPISRLAVGLSPDETSRRILLVVNINEAYMQRLSLHNPAAITFVSMLAKSINHTCIASINILFDNCCFYNDSCQLFLPRMLLQGYNIFITIFDF